MKKLALFSLLALTLSVASAKPPVEDDVLEGNDFVLGVDVSYAPVVRKSQYAFPFLYGNLSGQYITYATFPRKQLDLYTAQQDVNLNLNFRYGIFDYVEVFANANGYYQYTESNIDKVKNHSVNFGSANIGLMAALYKGESFHFIIGDNSDIITNAPIIGVDTHFNYFGGHTFFMNFIRQKSEGDRFKSATLQLYYRLNLTQKYTIGDETNKVKSGDETGARVLYQFGKEDALGFFGLNVGLKAADRFNGERVGINYYSSEDYSGMIFGFSLGGKKDINAHMGYKISLDYTNYSIDYNAYVASISLGLYFK